MSLRSREHDIGATSDPKMTPKRFQNDHKLRAKLTQGCKTYPGLRRRTGKPHASLTIERQQKRILSLPLSLCLRGAVFINFQIETGMLSS